jgi:hypothetical protein
MKYLEGDDNIFDIIVKKAKSVLFWIVMISVVPLFGSVLFALHLKKKAK